jgi:hypothetical protein
MVEMPLMLLLTELEKAELRDALGEGVEEEAESSEERSRSSKLWTGLMVEAIRLGTAGEDGVEGKGLPLTPLAILLDMEFTVACGPGERVDLEGLRPCSRPESLEEFSFGVEWACAGSWERTDTITPLINMISTGVLQPQREEGRKGKD